MIALTDKPPQVTHMKQAKIIFGLSRNDFFPTKCCVTFQQRLPRGFTTLYDSIQSIIKGVKNESKEQTLSNLLHDF